jgi:hypothetical protein
MTAGSLFSWVSRRWVCTAATVLLEVDRFSEGLSGPSARRLARSYRADAVIVLITLPVYRRTGVGSGSASLVEVSHQDDRYVSMRFTAASWPERAAGLDRVGCIREVVVERDGVPTEAAYFGVMTSWPGETLEEGRRSLVNAAGTRNEFAAIDGHSFSGRARSAVTHFCLPSARDPNVRIMEEALANFQAKRPAWHEGQWPCSAGQAPLTFLYALIRAIRSPKRSIGTLYVHSERTYFLRLEKRPDRQQGLGCRTRADVPTGLRRGGARPNSRQPQRTPDGFRL